MAGGVGPLFSLQGKADNGALVVTGQAGTGAGAVVNAGSAQCKVDASNRLVVVWVT